MTDDRVNILLVEDEAVLAMDLCDTLEAEGYAVVGTANNGRRALELFQNNRVDLLLCDIFIKGDWDGIDTAERLLAVRPVPVIYLTALADRDILARALATTPAAYLIKPATTTGLRAAIELALHACARPTSPPEAPVSPSELVSRETILRLDNYLFIKHNYQFVRLPLADILLLEADNTYTNIVATERKYALRLSIGHVLERLQPAPLVRVHRSYAVNMQHVSSFNEHSATVGSHVVPLGRQYKDAFLRPFQAS